MTATPIPRTIAMTVFGDLATSVLDELPAGRSAVPTHLVPWSRTSWVEGIWRRAAKEVASGGRVYAVCPRIEVDDEPRQVQTEGAAAFETEDGQGPEPLTDEVSDEIYLAMSLDEAVLTQRETVRSYPDYVRSLREEAEAKQRSGFFGAPDSFAGRSLRRAAAHYAHLEVLAPEPSFSGGITVLTDWRVTDGICAAGGAMAGLLLLTGEQAAGLLCLVRPTKNGRGALFRRKFAAMVAELAGLFVLTYGGNLAISAAVLGLGDLRRPVQAVIGLQGCPLPLITVVWRD